MTQYRKLMDDVLREASEASIRFEDLRLLLRRLGFEERVRASHHIFRRADVEERLNLQRCGSHAKVYQVRQVRDVIVRYGLGGGL